MGCGALIFRLKSAAKDLRTLMDAKGLVTLLSPLLVGNPFNNYPE